MCCLLTTLIGPSSALLAIPVYRSNWPAGGTDFWVPGNESLLWPDNLGASSTGVECQNPGQDVIYAMLPTMSHCIWYWTPGLTHWAKAAHFDANSYNITVYEGFADHQIQRRNSGDCWALASMAHVARISSLIGEKMALRSSLCGSELGRAKFSKSVLLRGTNWHSGASA